MKKFIRAVLKYLFDLVIIDISAALTILLICNFNLEESMNYADVFGWGILILDIAFILVMSVMRGYRVLWRFAGSMDRIKFTARVTTAHILYAVVHMLVTEGYPIAFYIINTLLSASGHFPQRGNQP